MRADRGPLRVMGIDPGLTRLGFGVIQEAGGRLELLDCGTLQTSAADDAPRRLLTLFDGLKGLTSRWQPEVVAMERLFLKLNARTGVPAIQASGVALLAAAHSGVPVREYAPAEVKMAVVGHGNATKNQIRYMVERILGAGRVPDSPDAADGLAVAITHLSCRRMARLEVVR
ncbi:MAG: crossover junction endodeoxyribonuclease RuvC [Actinomycetota bacterium]|nr:crossover junction endodeoxyribonuclease RuvC [Actinomycetota bacterium]